MCLLALVLADSFRTSPTPFIALMLGGFAAGAFGDLYGSRFIAGIGVALIFLATLLIPIALTVGCFGVGAFGYLFGSRFIVGIGVVMIFLATVLIPMALSISQ